MSNTVHAVPEPAVIFADGLPTPQRYWAVLAIALGITIAVLDGAIVNIALPGIARSLDVQPADAVWVVNAYQLAVVSLIRSRVSPVAMGKSTRCRRASMRFCMR